MQPLEPAERQAIFDSVGADPAEIDEYEALLAQRFTVDPDLGPVEGLQAIDRHGPRLEELTRKLFPDGIKQS